MFLLQTRKAMGCECCKVDTPKLYKKCEAIRIFTETHHKKKMLLVDNVR